MTRLDSSAPPSAARRLRSAWLGMATLALLSTLLPWSCKASAVRVAFDWSLSGDGASRLLGMSLWCPIAVLLAALALEARPRHYGRRALLPIALGALVALSMLAFTDFLPQPESVDANAIFRLRQPRPLAAPQGVRQTLLRLLLLAPVTSVATWTMTWGAGRLAPLGVRWIAGYTVAAVALTWSPFCDGPGFWLGAVTMSATAIVASLVPDTLPAAGPTARRALVLITAACLLAIASIVLPLRGSPR